MNDFPRSIVRLIRANEMYRSHHEPHNLLHEGFSQGKTSDECAVLLSEWAKNTFQMTASHPAGGDESGNPNKNLWSPHERTCPASPADTNSPVKLLMDVSESQEPILEDHLLLCNRINLHGCSDYCLRAPKNSPSSSLKQCRMEFCTSLNPGKPLRENQEIVRDRNGSPRLEMPRDHPSLIQHSQYHTQAWRANGDVSLILSKSGPENPSVDEIIAVEKYITGYACKGNEPTGAIADLFNDMVNCSDENSGSTTKSLCTNL
jgi:hypothetical protein